MKNFFYLVLLLGLSFTLSACVSFKGTPKDTSKIDGGVFKSDNKAVSWKQKVLIPTITGKPANFAGANVISLVMDPANNKVLYLGSLSSGLFYSLNGGDEWQSVAYFNSKTIRAIAVDPKATCRVFVAYDNKVFRTDDCLRTWKQIYYDNDPTVGIEDIIIDHYESQNIYLAISRGDILKSSDYGDSWRTIINLDDRVRSFAIDPKDSRNIFVITYKSGVYRTNSDENFIKFEILNNFLKEKDLGLNNVREMIFAGENKNEIFVSTSYGLVKSIDNGVSWEKLNLITSEEKASINSLAVNPKNIQEIYYVTNTTFYKSIDGGINWTPNKVQSSRSGWKLLIDPVEPNVIYMGLRKIEK